MWHDICNMQAPAEDREGIRLLEVEVMVVASGFWEANLGLLEEQRKLRTTEPSLQLASLPFFLSMGFQVYG